MNDAELARALRKGVQNAVIALYDAYADRLFQYCWLMLRNREMARGALLDAFAAADARSGRLPRRSAISPWMYSLARAECRRRTPAIVPDEPLARPAQHDADARLMAWGAVMALPADEREALDLQSRHGLGPSSIAAVLGLEEAEAGELLHRALRRLHESVGAEILLRRGIYACAGCAEAVRGSASPTAPAIRALVVAHAVDCRGCAGYLPRNVSARRVYGLLPAPEPGPRQDPRIPRADPADPAGPAGPAGPGPAGDRAGGRPGDMRWRLLAGIGAAAAAAGVVALIALTALRPPLAPPVTRPEGSPLADTTARPAHPAGAGQAAPAGWPGAVRQPQLVLLPVSGQYPNALSVTAATSPPAAPITTPATVRPSAPGPAPSASGTTSSAARP